MIQQHDDDSATKLTLTQPQQAASRSQVFRAQSPIRAPMSFHPAEGELSTHRVPTARSREAFRSASRVAAKGDVIERARSVRIKQGVQETERRKTGGEPLVVEQSDHARKRRARRTRPVQGLDGSVDVDLESGPLCRDIRVGTSGGVEQVRVRGAERLEVCFHRSGLILRARKDVRKAACGEGGRGLRGDTLSAPHGSNAVR